MMNMIGSMRADELMTQATAVTAADSVSKAIGILKRSKSYEILVVRKDRVEGLVSIRDILKARNIAGMRISSLITHVPQITAQDSVSLAAGIMTDHRIRTVPVVEKGKLVGQLTASSICERMSKQPKLNMNAAEIMTSQLVSLQEADTLAKARSLMIEKSIDHLPVLREREIAGIITSDAIVFRMSPPERISRKSIVSEERRQLDLQVRGLMAPDPVTCEPNTDVQEVIKAMNSRQTTYSLVSLWGELQGIITSRDCVKLLAEPRKEALPLFIVGLPEDPFEAELARTKFERIIKRLARSLPDLLEARSVIKTSEKSGHRQRYEVTVELITPRKTESYSSSGWSLPEVYEVLSDRMKRLTTKKRRPRIRRPTRA